MIVRRLKSFIKQYKKLLLLLSNWKHPSLHTKKMKGYPNIWELRVDYHHRLTFQVTTNHLTVRTVGHHDILKKP